MKHWRADTSEFTVRIQDPIDSLIEKFQDLQIALDLPITELVTVVNILRELWGDYVYFYYATRVEVRFVPKSEKYFYIQIKN